MRSTPAAPVAVRLTEAELQASIIDACRWAGVLSYHTFSSRHSPAGFPDLVLVGDSGVLYRELKSERGRLTPDQRRWLDRLTAAGQDADVWRPVDWPGRIMSQLEAIR